MSEAPKPDLTFARLAKQNLARCEDVFHPINDWSPTDWMTACAGELGEAANLIKKARRTNFTMLDYEPLIVGAMTLRQRIAEELADTIIYIDLLATAMEIDLAKAVITKFNITSKDRGSGVTL